MIRPLDGVKVLDFTRHMAGPYGTLMLADYGADVIKVEGLTGDPSRITGVDFVDGVSAVFLTWNRGKRSVAVDMRSEEGLAVVHRLARDADIVVENYRPGQADNIGIGYERLSDINDQIIYCSVSAFGPRGPLAPYPGTDPVVQAASGVMSVTGEPDRGPSLVGVPIADFTGAMMCVQAALLGLLAREKSGRGQKIEVSMLSGLMSALTTRLASFWTTGEDPVRNGSAHTIVVPYEAFATADGHAVAGVWGGSDKWGPFCEALGVPELAEDPRYASNVERVRRSAELRPVLAAEFVKRTTAEWEPRFRERGVLFHPVLSFSEIFAHEQVAAAGIVQSVEHPTLGSIPQLGPAIELSDTPGAITLPPPLLGEHTVEVLEAAGYSSDEVMRLARSGVIGLAEPVASPEVASPAE